MAIEISPEVQATLKKLLATPAFQEAMEYLKEDEANRFEELKEIVQIHGAPFKEHVLRSPMYKSKLETYGCQDCHIDAEGNVMGYVYGTGPSRPKVLTEGHLDTVFAESVPLHVTEKDGRWYCPGIGDDTAALACNLSVLRAIKKAGLKPVGTIVFGGTVGEEGEGNSRGIRFLMKNNDDIDALISVESHPADHVCLQAVGIRRLEFVFKGPGGHSWRAFGTPNPVHAMARAAAKIAEMQVPEKEPRSTFSVGLVNGGTSINVIPEEARMKVDMRSVSLNQLNRMASEVTSYVEQAVGEENLRWKSTDRVTFTVRVIGDKPAGTLPADNTVAMVAFAATEYLGFEAKPASPASTNQNVPLAMGIPSIVVGSGGTFKGVHTVEESYTPAESYKGAQKVLLILFALAGLDGVTEPLATPCLNRGPVC